MSTTQNTTEILLAKDAVSRAKRAVMRAMTGTPRKNAMTQQTRAENRLAKLQTIAICRAPDPTPTEAETLARRADEVAAKRATERAGQPAELGSHMSTEQLGLLSGLLLSWRHSCRKLTADKHMANLRTAEAEAVLQTVNAVLIRR